MAQTTEEISCFGQFGCVDNFHEFLFRIHTDGSLSVLLERTSKRRWLAETSEQEDSGEEEDLHGENEPQCGLIYGRARKDEASEEYDVDFAIGAWRPSMHQGAGMICKGRLSVRGLTGTYRNLREQGGMANLYGDDDDNAEAEADHAEEEVDFPFELVTRQQAFSAKRLRQSFLPVVPGEFTFEGFALTNTLELLNTTVTIELLSDGTLIGKLSQSLKHTPFLNVTLQGTWTCDEILCTTRTKQDPRPKYSFHGSPLVMGMHGSWLIPGVHPLDFQFESAIFNLRLSDCSGRLWSEALHPYFPDDFRENARWLLLSSLRGSSDSSKVVLPSELWLQVFSYTDDQWFSKEKPKKDRDDNALKRVFDSVFGPDSEMIF